MSSCYLFKLEFKYFIVNKSFFDHLHYICPC